MIKNSTVRTLLLSGVVILAIVLTAVFATSHLAQLPAHAAAYTPPPGQSNISQLPGKQAHYYPNTLSCTRPKGHSCSITIKNTTSASQSVTLKGKVIYTLKPTQSQSISYKNAGTYTYGLSSNAKATLTVTVS